MVVKIFTALKSFASSQLTFDNMTDTRTIW